MFSNKMCRKVYLAWTYRLFSIKQISNKRNFMDMCLSTQQSKLIYMYILGSLLPVFREKIYNEIHRKN